MKINYLEESAMERKTQPARTADAATSALDGVVVNVTEIHRTSDPVMYPDLPAVEWKRTTQATVSLPKAWRPLLCVECDGARRPGSADPLDLDHDERCVLGAEDRAQVERDLAVIRREMARGGRSWRARVATDVERMLLSEYGVVAPSRCTTIHLGEDGRWWRTWRWLDEPALTAG